MSYRIAKGETLAKAFGRIAAEEMDLAMTQLERRDHGEAVQDVRKALKRLRALLRSLRVACPKNLYRKENRRLADAAHKISPLRDLHVQLETLKKLRKDDPASDPVKRRLEREQTTCLRRMPALRKTLCAMLQASRQGIGSFPVRHATPSDLAAGLRRIYKQGRSAFKTARRNPTAQNLHQARKKAKWLGYGFELIEGTHPKKVSQWRRSAEELTDALGDDHDLFMVLTALRQAHRAVPGRDFQRLARRIARKRAQRQKKALKIAKILYRAKPRAFGQQVDHYLCRARTPLPATPNNVCK
ncbi:MAG: CHAD domain-containing protein [Limisphaerales bacterium]